jgi:hypothetical protein
VVGKITVANHGANGKTAPLVLPYLGERKVVYIDKRCRLLNPILHQVNEICPASEKPGALSSNGIERLCT